MLQYNDPDFTQPIIRYVCTEVTDNYGRPHQQVTKSKVRAIVTQPNNGDLIRYVDSTTYTKAICVTSSMVFYPDNLTGQPDVILYHGEHYVVVGVEDYRDFGYTRAICALTDFQAAASDGDDTLSTT